MKPFLIFTISACILVINACTEKKPEQVQTAVDETGHQDKSQNLGYFTKGDIVPKDEVCMVNNAYMGKKQIEVKYNGKLYYGCCKMCEERIPKEKSVRMAVDPVSQKEVDKADAFIAITGDKGEVSYFENETNYNAYSKTLDLK